MIPDAGHKLLIFEETDALAHQPRRIFMPSKLPLFRGG